MIKVKIARAPRQMRVFENYTGFDDKVKEALSNGNKIPLTIDDPSGSLMVSPISLVGYITDVTPVECEVELEEKNCPFDYHECYISLVGLVDNENKTVEKIYKGYLMK